MIEWTTVLAATAFALVCIRKAQLAERRDTCPCVHGAPCGEHAAMRRELNESLVNRRSR